MEPSLLSHSTTLQRIDMRIKRAYDRFGGTDVTTREILKILYKDGWRKVDARTRGSHIQLTHPRKPGKVTVPFHRGDIAPGTLSSILRQAGLRQ